MRSPRRGPPSPASRAPRGSSVVVFISRNGVEAAVQIAGLPDRWFTFPAPLVGDPLYRPGFSDEDAAPDIGDSALVECCGLGGAASAASPSVAAFLGGGLADAIERTREMGDICIGRSERLRIPVLDGEGTPLGVDARACVDLGRHAAHQHGDPAPRGRRPDRRRHRPHADRADPRRPRRAGPRAARLMGTEWEAQTYGRISAPQFAWGSRIVERIPLRGDEDVLDAGCGTGRVTRLLAERVPDGTVLGVDGSHRMVEEAAAQLADLAPRVRFAHADLTELALPEPVDADRLDRHLPLDPRPRGLFRRLFDALRPGGRSWRSAAATATSPAPWRRPTMWRPARPTPRT